MATGIREETRFRISEALSAVNQANTVYSLIFVVLAEFPGFDSDRWFFKLAAQVRFSGLVEPQEALDAMLGAAFREIADRRLPRLLCISLVSTMEACLLDIAAIEIAAHRRVSSEEATGEATKLMRGGPQEYLPKLAALGLAFVAGQHWQELREIVATRNVLVHRSQLVADERYVKQAGEFARVLAGAQLPVDNDYLLQSYFAIRSMLYDALAEPDYAT